MVATIRLCLTEEDVAPAVIVLQFGFRVFFIAVILFLPIKVPFEGASVIMIVVLLSLDVQWHRIVIVIAFWGGLDVL